MKKFKKYIIRLVIVVVAIVIALFFIPISFSTALIISAVFDVITDKMFGYDYTTMHLAGEEIRIPPENVETKMGKKNIDVEYLMPDLLKKPVHYYKSRPVADRARLDITEAPVKGLEDKPMGYRFSLIEKTTFNKSENGWDFYNHFYKGRELPEEESRIKKNEDGKITDSLNCSIPTYTSKGREESLTCEYHFLYENFLFSIRFRYPHMKNFKQIKADSIQFFNQFRVKG